VPYVINRPPRRALALVAACLGLAVTAAPAAANTTSCALPVSNPVFASLGDTADYFALPGGTFEGSLSGWSLNGAHVVQGNAPLDAAAGSHSLNIEPGGEAVSPTVCLNNKMPTWRFYAQAADAASLGTGLQVLAQWTDPYSGRTFELPIAHRNGSSHAKWKATPALLLGKYLPDGVNVNVRFVFTAAPKGGAWALDDVFVDPYAR
jgi:hypothetical protein